MCDVGEYLDYENCKCKKELVNKLLEECPENVKEVKLSKIASPGNENVCKCSSCALFIVLSSIIFQLKLELVAVFLFSLILKKHITRVKFGTHTQTTIWLLIL